MAELDKALFQLHIWSPSKDARADCLFLQPGQMVEKLAVILSRRLLWFPHTAEIFLRGLEAER